MIKSLYEIFDEVAAAQTDEDRIRILRANGRQTVKNVLQGAFHPAIKFVIKQRVPYNPAKETPAGMGYTSIDVEQKRIYIFVEGSTKVDPGLKLPRKINILIQILESMEPREAEIFMNMILKDLKVPGLTYDVVKRAFPDIKLP